MDRNKELEQQFKEYFDSFEWQTQDEILYDLEILPTIDDIAVEESL